ncbi:hypothetical protein I7I53_10331 [Histoplasma capsulatum var. duboisii H88]|uniref:Uncharacterized protein n=2 Tax=Ajellomyces capsulatus (strain H88) TaxID=544711 RepID=A0A8A1LDJ0_AJEC8|nr:hypothetical protein I7I53_10331 [Histoplasma capsulatum var. duboisii H88]
MFRLRPTPIILSDDEIYSCVRRILIARILEKGGDPLVSPLQRRLSSSEAPSTDSPYMAPDSSSFEEFTDCGPDDCDSSPALNNGKRKCETSSDNPQTEQPQLSPAPQVLPSSSADVQLAEQLDTITLSFTSFLSPSTWLGPFTSYPRLVGGNMRLEWGDDISTGLNYQMKSFALPVPTDLALLQSDGLYSKVFPYSGGSVLGCINPNPIPPGSTRCSSPCCQSIPSTPPLSDSQGTDSESDTEDGFFLSTPNSSRNITSRPNGTNLYFYGFGHSPATEDAIRCNDINRTPARRSSNKNAFHSQRNRPAMINSSYTSATSSLSFSRLDSISLNATSFDMHCSCEKDMLAQMYQQSFLSPPASQRGSANQNQYPSVPAGSREGADTMPTSSNLGQVYPITSANTVVPTGETPLIAPQAIANQIPYIERVPQEAAGLPQVRRTAIFCTSPWLSQQPNVPIYAISTAANQLQDTMPQRHAAINYYHVPLSSIFGNPVTPSAALSPAVVPTYRLNQQHEQQYIVPATRLASAYTAGHGYVFQQRRHQAVHNNTNNQAMAPIHLPAGMAEIPRGTTWQIQRPSSTAGPAIHSGRATTAFGHHSDGNIEGEVKAP